MYFWWADESDLGEANIYLHNEKKENCKKCHFRCLKVLHFEIFSYRLQSDFVSIVIDFESAIERSSKQIYRKEEEARKCCAFLRFYSFPIFQFSMNISQSIFFSCLHQLISMIRDCLTIRVPKKWATNFGQIWNISSFLCRLNYMNNFLKHTVWETKRCLGLPLESD